MPGTDLTILHFGRFPRCSAVVDKHFDGYCTLQLITSGAIHLSYDHAVHTLRGTWLFPCFPGPRIRFHVAPPHKHWTHRYIAFRGPLMDRWLAENLLTFSPQQPPTSDLPARFDAMLALAPRSDRLGRLRVANAIESLLLELADARPSPQTTWLDSVHAALDRQETFWPDYHKLAADLRLALSTLRKRYRQASGGSLHHAILRRRVDAARDLLIHTQLPVKQIAARLGYNDVYFFSRQFRSIAGLPPAAFRRSRQD